ncbi:MAG: hypothetical protein WDZ29_06035 [Balneolaceae bacterium]
MSSAEQDDLVEDFIPFDAGPILFIHRGEIWSMEEDGSNVRKLTNFLSMDFPIGDAQWSPDGSKIAVTASADPGNPDEWARAIYIMNADGTDMEQLTHPPLGHVRNVGDVSRGYRWSPDGNRIAFTRMRPPEALGMLDVYIVDLETGVESLISGDKQVRDWRPGGDELLVSYRDGGKFRLGLLDIYHDTLRAQGSLDYNNDGGRFSPGGFHLVYSRLDSDQRGLYLLDVETREEELLFDQVEYPGAVAWSSSGDRLLFQTWATADEDRKVYIMHIDTGEVVNITPLESPESWVWVSSWRSW